MEDWKKMVQELDLSRLEEGDIVTVTTGGSQYRIEVLESCGQGRKYPRMRITGGRHFSQPTEAFGVGTNMSKKLLPILLVGRSMGVSFIRTGEKGKMYFIRTSLIRSIEVDRA